MSRFWLMVALATGGCTPDQGVAVQKRILTTEEVTFDAGTIAVSDRYTMTIYLASVGAAPVNVWDIYLEDETDPNWVVLPSWAIDTLDHDGVEVQALEIDGGTEENPTYAPVEINFRPETEGYFRQTLIIESNDNHLVEKNAETGNAIWRVILRGVARYPCANVYPTFHDFGIRPAGGYFDTTVNIENCGSVTLTAENYTVTGDASFGVDSVFQIPVVAGSTSPLILSWIPDSSSAADAEIDLITNDPDYADTITVIGNDCSSSVDTSWDRDGDGWFSCGGDCDDTDETVSPEAVDDKDEGADGIDNDCDGSTDEGAGLANDGDSDGQTENDGDCMDYDATVYVGAPELLDSMDNDCDGTVDEGSEWYDDDADGLSEREGDCDDASAAVYPGAEEAYDSIDNDCDGHLDEGSYSFDDDEDGYAELQSDGSDGDCEDDNPWAYPGATEDCDDVDNDCDNLVDEGDDDAEGGACDFVVETKAITSATDSSCATSGGPASATSVLVLAAGLATRRRRRRR